MGSRLLVYSSAAEMELQLEVQDGVQVGLQVSGLLLEPSEVSEAETEAGRLISDWWPDLKGMRQTQIACQKAALMEDLVEIWWELQAEIEIFVEFEGWRELSPESVKVLEAVIEVWLGFGLME